MIRIRQVLFRCNSWLVFFAFMAVAVGYQFTDNENWFAGTMSSFCFAVIEFGWFWVVGTELNDNLPAAEKRSNELFAVCCLYLMLSVPCVTLFSFTDVSETMKAVLQMTSLLAMVCLIYVLYFFSMVFGASQDRSTGNDKFAAEVIFILVLGFFFFAPLLHRRAQKFVNKSAASKP